MDSSTSMEADHWSGYEEVVAVFISLCMVAFVLVPITSASAAKLTGACAVSGKAAFFTKGPLGKK